MSLAEPSPDGPAPQSPVDRRNANSRAIIAAAHRLIEQQHEGFTTQELIKEAGVALQTFYRHFAGKDQLLLAVIAELIAEHCRALEARAQHLDDPVERLHVYVTASLESLASPDVNPQFITAEHWRLHQLYPEEMSAATKPVADLIRRELEAGQAAGVLAPRDPERDAWLINRMIMAAYHHYAFLRDDHAVDTVADDVWEFCLAAVGGGGAPSRRLGLKRRGRKQSA